MIFPIFPLLACIVGVFVSIAHHVWLGMVISFAGTVAVLIADWHALKQRAKRPDFNAWDEI